MRIFLETGLDDRGSIPGRDNDGIFSLCLSVQTGSAAHPASYQMFRGGFYSGIKRPWREDDNSLPFNAEVKNTWSYTSTPPLSSWRSD
jgi:hypothetical protein